MLQNLHTHTVFCDGRDTPREMIETAIEKGFDSLGFSGHATSEKHSGCELKDIPGYVKEINSLKEEYKDRIKIFLGIELDYFSAGVMPELVLDYRIGSVHFVKKNGHLVEYDHSYEHTRRFIDEDFGGDGIAYAKAYYEVLADMPNKLKADFVGHFDLVTKFSEQHPELFDMDSKEYKNAALEALHAVREKMEFFEVNTGAIGRGYRKTPYPAPFLLDEMKRLDCKLLLSSDCHNRNYLDCHFNECYEYLRAHGYDTLYYLTENGFAGEKI